jgi:hypothetical protein
MLFEDKEKMNKKKKLLYNRQPFMNRVGKIRFCTRVKSLYPKALGFMPGVYNSFPAPVAGAAG